MFDFKSEIKNRAEALDISIPEEILQKFDEFFVMLKEESAQYNLIGPMDDMKIVKYLFIDSLAFLRYFPIKPGDRIIDIGSGAGFPGVVLKLMTPEIEMTFLDSSGKKINFLKTVCEKLSLDKVDFLYIRAEDAGKEPENREKYDYVTARAVAAVPVLIELCAPFVKKEGKIVLWKGKKAGEEVVELKKGYKLLGLSEHRIVTFKQEKDGEETAYVSFEKIRTTPAKFPRSMSAIKKKTIGNLTTRELSR